MADEEEAPNREGLPPAMPENSMDNPWAHDSGTIVASTDVPNSEVSDLNETAEDFDFSGVEVPGEDQERLDESKALRVFSKRIPLSASYNRILRKAGSELGASAMNSRYLAAELQRKLLVMIPENLWTEEFLSNVDIRPMLQAVMTGPYIQGDPEQKSTVRGVEMTAQERAIAAVMLTDEQKAIEKQLIEAHRDTAPEGDTELIEHAITTATNEANAWRTGGVGMRPVPPEGTIYRDSMGGISSSTDANESTASSAAVFNAEISGDEFETKFMNQRQLQLLTQSGELFLDDVLAMETDPQGIGVDGVDYTTRARIEYEDTGPVNDLRMATTPDGRPAYTGDAEFQDDQAYKGKDWYSVREILRKPNGMNRDELQALHEKLKKSGFYDLVGGEPVIPGDPQDPAFKAAWKLLASVSLEKGVPMTTVLAERTTEYQQELNSRLSVSLTDPARIRTNANAVAYDMLGRHLTDEEQVQMQKFVHDLERRNARIEAGLDINSGDSDPIDGVESLDEGIVADIDAQMAEYMRNENEAEAGAADIADSYDMFTRMLAGPGRGVGT